MKENGISYLIRGTIYDIYNTFGPRLLESIYVAALEIELKRKGLKVRSEVAVPVYYQNEKLKIGYR